ncbi:MAG: GtrA family protein [Alphaproteobacteria bacterium]
MEPTASRVAFPLTGAQLPALDELWRYFVVSCLALGVDYGLLIALIELLSVHYLISGAVSFLAGAVVAYLGSVLWVFSARRLSDRGQEVTLFILIGVGGLGINELVLWSLTDYVALHYSAAKLGAAGAGFVFNFVARKVILFR